MVTFFFGKSRWKIRKIFRFIFFFQIHQKIAAEKFQVDTSSGFGGIFEN